MITKEKCTKPIKNFRIRSGIETSDENIIASIHLMNSHSVDFNTSLDQSSRSSNDKGIDAWFYDDVLEELFIYQSKFSESKSLVLNGFKDLKNASLWLEKLLIEGTVDTVPSDNHCLFNLYRKVSDVRNKIKRIHFTLISLFEKDELEDSNEYKEFEDFAISSNLNKHVIQNLKGKIFLAIDIYNLEGGLPEKRKVYTIKKIANARVDLRNRAHLDLAYISLYSLVELYRQRGDVLFDKNIRLSLVGTREAKERLVNPMENTFDLITSGKLSPSIFPFYHIGVTITANSIPSDDTDLLNLEGPSIINGCQTITIANEYLKKLEKQEKIDKIDLFKQIQIIAKVVIGISDEELKEITNANNRQNPIENWQLFSNEPIHIEIETTLKEIGVFYERQKGKFDTVMKTVDNAKYYHATNGTYVRIMDLGQLISYAKGNLQWAAKPSEIFLRKENHEVIFDKTIPKYPYDVLLCSNLFKAMKRGLTKYLELPTHANSNATIIFNKPIVKANVFYLTLLYYYQNDDKWTIRRDYSKTLYKIASPIIVDDMQSFFMKIVTQIKNWYNEETNNLSHELSKKKMDEYFMNLAIRIKVDIEEGALPFSEKAINWDEYKE